MSSVFPFAAFSPTAENAPLVATLPYDVMNRSEAAAMAEGNPKSFLRVTRSEIELPADINPYAVKVYQTATENWKRFIKEGLLTQDSDACYYVYSLVMNGRRQTGIVAAASVDDYDNGIIVKHETTRREKEDDRTRHISMLRAQTGPVFLTYNDSEAIDKIVELTMRSDAMFDFTAPDGIRHTGWRVSEEFTEALQLAFKEIPKLYIADGHHRAASASRTRATLVENHTDTTETARFLAVIFPASQLKILAYNRLILNLGALTPDQYFKQLETVCQIAETDETTPKHPGEVCMYFQKRWYQLTFKQPAADASPVEKLDVSILQNQVLDPILDIGDPRSSKRIDFVGGVRGTDELKKRVDSGEAIIAFSMYPTSIAQLMEIADNGFIMPPKSTWFEPKLRDGLFVHEI